MKYRNRIIGSLLVGVMTASTLVGCSQQLSDTEVVGTVGEEEITVGVANFYIRYQQSSTEAMYASMFGGADMFEPTPDIMDPLKDSMVTGLEDLYLIKQKAESLGVSVSEEETAAIEAAADAFIETNGEEDRSLVSGNKEDIVEVLTLITLESKAREVIVADANTEVSDEEAAQKKMTYVAYPFGSTDAEGNYVESTEEEKDAMKAQAESLLEVASGEANLLNAAGAAGATPQEITFDAESTAVDAAVIEAADTLGEGEFTEVIETDNGYYIAQVTSLLDREATDAKKESIVATRQDELYVETVEGYREETEIKINEDVVEKIDLIKVGVEVVVPEVEEATDVLTEETAEESADDTSEEATEDTSEETTEDTATDSE